MSNQNQNLDQEKRDDLKIAWFGIDGLLCLLYVVEAIVFAYAIITNNDFIVGTLVPYGVAIVTIAIFIKYISQVIGVSRKNGDKSSPPKA